MGHALTVSDRSDQRWRAARRLAGNMSTLRDPGNVPLDVTVADLSTTGFAIECLYELVVGDQVRLGLPGEGSYEARVVRRDGDTYGCEFLTPLPNAAVADAFTRSIVQSLPLQLEIPSPALEAEIEPKWPRAARGWFLLSAAGASWAAILWAVLR